MSDLKNIKDRLRDEDKIERLLEAIGCEYVKPEQRGELVTAQLPERYYSNNKRAVQVRLNESLSCYIRNRTDFKGDIFSLVSYIHYDKRGEEIDKNLPKAKEFICNLFGWNEFLNKKGFKDVIVKDYTASLKAIIGEKKKAVEIKSNPILPDDIMNRYYFYGKPLPYKGWIEEGISYKTQMIYGVGFDLESKRIVFPLKNRFGKIVGVKGRIMKDEDDDRKYLYLHPCQNRYEWFNFHLAHQHILLKKKVYIFEAEKSCMKAHTLGIYNTLGIGGSEISEEQVEMIKQLGLDIKIILCYDKGISVEQIKNVARLFEGREIYGMYDIDNVLNDKDSPIDKGIDTWNYLLKNNVYKIKIGQRD